MATGMERGLDNLIRGSEELIRDLEFLRVTDPTGIAVPDRVAQEISRQAEVSMESMVEPSIDGSVEIRLSPDEMTASACFHPPFSSGAPLSLEAARGAIEGMGITFGIAWEAVKGSILTCNEERIEVADVVVARGKRPRDERPPFLVLDEKLVSREEKNAAERARIDFKELSLFTLVKKGDVLATLMPKQDGAMGVTVRGVTVPFSKEPVPAPRPGRNTEWREGAVLAACDGRFQAKADGFWVDEVLDIRGDIDLRVGNLDFPGDVVIHGEIRDGFTVKSGKSILCTGCVGAARVECKGDLVTQQGIVGKDKAVLLVGGALEAKFLEGCAVDAGGPVRIRTSVLNSTVHTRERLEMGERGIIIGGVVKAQNGVTAAQIGTERGPRTEIHCGIDFKVEQKLVWIRDRNIALAFKLREIDAKAKASPNAAKVLEPLRQRIKDAIHQLNESARAMVTSLDRNEEADVTVRGAVFPGTYVEICHVSHFITRPVRTVTFQLDKAQGKIAERRLSRPSAGGAGAANTRAAARGAPSR